MVSIKTQSLEKTKMGIGTHNSLGTGIIMFMITVTMGAKIVVNTTTPHRNAGMGNQFNVTRVNVLVISPNSATSALHRKQAKKRVPLLLPYKTVGAASMVAILRLLA